jgi:protein-tyrosine phosphatase
MRSILFVCTANICRSPTAEGVFRKILASRGAAQSFDIDSAGTHDYYSGKPPYPQAVAVAKARGYDLTHLVARRIRSNDFDHFDLILAMDRSNIESLKSVCPTRCKQKIELLLDYGDLYGGLDVPDPYGGQLKDFERTLDMIEDGCRGLADLLVRVA